jgi:hypothetical protein
MPDTPTTSPAYIHVSFQITEENYEFIRQAIEDCGLADSSEFYQMAASLLIAYAAEARNLKRPGVIDDFTMSGRPIQFGPLDIAYAKALDRNAFPQQHRPVPKPHLKVVE